MDNSYADLLAFDRAVRVRGAQRAIELPEGVAVRHDGLPKLHHLNALLLDTPLPGRLVDPVALAAFADGQLTGLGHLEVVLDDFDAAGRLAPSLLESGWTRQRLQYMLRVRDPDRAPAPHPVTELGAAKTQEFQRAITAEEAPAHAHAVVDQLVAGQAAMRAGTRSLVFGAAEPGGPLASSCTLFLGGGIAMIDEVGTLAALRQRGLARAAVSAAVQYADDHGCHRIFVPAEIDDWPQLLYQKLGFEPMARQVSFTLRRAAAAGRSQAPR